MPSTRVSRHRKFFGEVSCTECTGQRNDFELIPTVKIETIHPVEGSVGNEFPSMRSYGGLKSEDVEKIDFFAFFGKTTPYGEIFKILFRKYSRHRSTCCVQIS